jgi:hypothetical protein
MRTRSLTLIAAAIVAAGSFLPWVQVLGISVSGIQGDGVLTLIGATLATALAFIARRWASISVIVLGALCLGVVLNDWTNFAGIGIFVTLAGSVTLIIAGARAARGTRVA